MVSSLSFINGNNSLELSGFTTNKVLNKLGLSKKVSG